MGRLMVRKEECEVVPFSFQTWMQWLLSFAITVVVNSGSFSHLIVGTAYLTRCGAVLRGGHLSERWVQLLPRHAVLSASCNHARCSKLRLDPERVASRFSALTCLLRTASSQHAPNTAQQMQG